MKKATYLAIAIVIILIAIGAWFSLRPMLVETGSKPANSSFPVVDGSVGATEVIISRPQANEVISSPLTVTGQAKGNWFFEATLPVRLEDAAGQVIASAPGRAQSDWMTDQLVPFSATLDFTTSASAGYLVISKDNPSGLPENDASVRIPVNF